MPRQVSSFIATAISTFAFVVPVAAPAVGPVAAESCFGVTPTIVGSSGSVIGTEGPDVVVTNGAAQVSTLGGDDLVCITGLVMQGFFDSGAGNDRIDSSAVSRKSYSINITLGPGADEMIGGPQGEHVWADGESAGEVDRDVIHTAGGHDLAVSGGSAVNEDVITLGRASDELALLGAAPLATFKGGSGRDQLTLGWRGAVGDAWGLDNRTQRATRRGTLAVRWSSFSDFAFQGNWRAPVTFLGTNRRERLSVFVGGDWAVDARMGGGRDTFAVTGGAPSSRFDGGGGTDSFRHFLHYDSAAPPNSTLLLDLGTGMLQQTLRGETTTQRAVHFENAALFGEVPTTIWGTAGPNRLRKRQWDGVTIYGRGGDDHIHGGGDDDTLVGGPGHDTAYGQEGTDRCYTEVRVNCER